MASAEMAIIVAGPAQTAADTEDCAVLPGQPDSHKKNVWTDREILALVQARRTDREDYDRGAKGSCIPAAERWRCISAILAAQGFVRRKGDTVSSKWKTVHSDYRKVQDYQKSGQKSYWELSSEDRRVGGLPANLSRKMYSTMNAWLHSSSSTEPEYVEESGSSGGDGRQGDSASSEDPESEENDLQSERFKHANTENAIGAVAATMEGPSTPSPMEEFRRWAAQIRQRQALEMQEMDRRHKQEAYELAMQQGQEMLQLTHKQKWELDGILVECLRLPIEAHEESLPCPTLPESNPPQQQAGLCPPDLPTQGEGATIMVSDKEGGRTQLSSGNLKRPTPQEEPGGASLKRQGVGEGPAPDRHVVWHGIDVTSRSSTLIAAKISMRLAAEKSGGASVGGSAAVFVRPGAAAE
eukprot:TRINITY_DN7243_c0_g1_i4.p2 TRINITY_DN7243_c0_g1~~TRINITY_DN7243_c0_g1_i4.p2  ORF type:complete len:411 (+),score=59.10 TRINITY_DN7243_c0_g1_i4:2919-4151(+)